jgi:hypothetical protein
LTSLEILLPSRKSWRSARHFQQISLHAAGEEGFFFFAITAGEEVNAANHDVAD